MKTTKDVLLDEVKEDLSQYLKAGMKLNSFSKKIDPGLNIDEMERLLRIHFVLTGGEEGRVGVIDFIKKLQNRLRRIKTTVEKEKKLFDGEIRGRICWKDTLNKRYSQNPLDNCLFVCTQQERNYDIPENLVLKRLLQITHDIVYRELIIAVEKEYGWVKEWFEEEKKLQKALNHTFLKNVYLRRINLEDVHVTRRMIYRAMNSRQPLYREAATLLSRYQKLMNYELDEREAKELLRNTFIRPEKTEVLFELYWIIKIIESFKKEIGFENIRYKIIEPDKNLIAEWSYRDGKYKLYHDSTGNFDFSEKYSELSKKVTDKDNYLGRELKVLEKLEKMTGKQSDSLWGGRPDILLEKYGKKGKLELIFIGEVKYTNNRSYILQGMKELLEYMALIKKDAQYLEKYDNVFDKLEKVKGGLFIDKTSDIQIKREDNIRIISFDDNIKNLVT